MNNVVSRRHVLLGGAAALTGASLVFGSYPLAWAEGDEFDKLRLRRFDQLTGGPIDQSRPEFAAALDQISAEATETMATFDRSGTRTALWPDLPLRSDTGRLLEANVSLSYSRIASVATAWATRGTAQDGDAALAADLVGGLTFLYEDGYNESMSVSGNWWFWQIGNPMHVGNACTLLYDVIDPADLAAYMATVAKFAPDPNVRTPWGFPETGANRSDKSLYAAVRGILTKDAAVIAMARDALSDVVGDGHNSLFRYVTSGDGFYRDGSFVQHGRLPYCGTYGAVAVSGVSSAMALLGNSTWKITDPNQSVILDSIEKTFAPFIFSGRMMDTVRGRAVSRQREPDYRNAFSVISSALLLALAVDGAQRAALQAQAVRWIHDCDVDYLTSASVPQLSRALAVLDSGLEPAPALIGSLHFADQERTVHRRPGWSFTVSTSSSRIGRYEWGNRENAHGWYQGDGVSYLYLPDDQSHFSDDWWPTSDPYRLPGITVSTVPRESGLADGTGIPRAFRPWAGGTTLDEVSTIGMDHLNHDKSLSGRKSWFCLPDGIVALGAAIRCTSSHGVESVVEHRRLPGDGTAPVRVDGKRVLPEVGDSLDLTDPGWAHLADVGGYVFLSGGRIRLLREERSGSWRSINDGGDTGGNDDVKINRFLTLWFDHGTRPADATYAYQLMPTASVEATAERAAHPKVTVLANTAAVQAIAVPSSRLLLANFFAADDLDAVSSSGPCAVIMKRTQEATTVSVSDPSRTQESVRVTLPDGPVHRVVSASPGVEILDSKPLTISFPTGGSRGHDHTITVAAR